jgi:hypothetical protein
VHNRIQLAHAVVSWHLHRAVKAGGDMIADRAGFILEGIAISLRRAAGRPDLQVRVGDQLDGFGLSRLRLLAALIELEEAFAVEFPPDTVEGFRLVGDLAFYIQAHGMAPYDDTAQEFSAPVKRQWHAFGCLNRFRRRAWAGSLRSTKLAAN